MNSSNEEIRKAFDGLMDSITQITEAFRRQGGCPYCAERASMNVRYNVSPPMGPCNLHADNAVTV